MSRKLWIRPIILMIAGIGVIYVVACGGGGSAAPQTMTLSVSAITPSEVSLDWTPHPETISNYSFVRNGEDTVVYYLGSTSGRNRMLEPLTRYCYVVYAIRIPLGSVGKSNEACVTTPGVEAWSIDTIDSGREPALVLDNGNLPRISYRNASGVMLAYKDASDWKYSIVDEGAGIYGDTDIEIDSAGANSISYIDGINDRLMYASDLTGVWITDISSDRVGGTNALELDANGYAHVAYESYHDSTGTVLNYATNLSGDWQIEFLVGYSSGSISDIDMLIDGPGVVHIVFVTRGIKCYIHLMNNQGGNWQNEIVAEDSNCGAAPALDSAGNIYIAYSTKFGLMLTRKAGDFWQAEQLDSFSWIGGEEVGLAIDNADRLHIAYRDQNYDLKYITNVDGLWRQYFIDSIGDVGADPSVAVDAAGIVNIVYLDRTNETIKIATGP